MVDPEDIFDCIVPTCSRRADFRLNRISAVLTDDRTHLDLTCPERTGLCQFHKDKVHLPEAPKALIHYAQFLAYQTGIRRRRPIELTALELTELPEVRYAVSERSVRACTRAVRDW